MGTEIIKKCGYCGKELKAISPITKEKKDIIPAFEAAAFSARSTYVVKYFNDQFNYFCNIDHYKKVR